MRQSSERDEYLALAIGLALALLVAAGVLVYLWTA